MVYPGLGSGADTRIRTEDLLFATLDPTVRKIQGMHCGEVLLADTVGFVSDLPHELIAAFRATLQEAREADLLLHVADAYDQQIEVRVGALTSILEPLLIVVMGGVVGGIAFAILMPLLQLNEMIQ